MGMKRRTVKTLPAAIVQHVHKVRRKVLNSGNDIELHNCFWNAWRMAMYDDSRRIRYYEGFLYSSGHHRLHHAWNVVDGYIVDLTIKLAHKQARKHFKQMGMSTKPPRDRYEGREYAGLELAEKFAELFHTGVKIKS